MEERIINLERTSERHTEQIETLFSKLDSVKTQLCTIQNTLNQIRYMFLGGLAWFILTEVGILTALKVMA
jgi:hypothetical protein